MLKHMQETAENNQKTTSHFVGDVDKLAIANYNARS
jgi:hypothetical protein